MNKPLYASTNPEILVKIGPLVSELPGLEIRPLKMFKEKIIGKIYNPFCKFAERTKKTVQDIDICTRQMLASQIESKLNSEWWI